MRPTNPTFTADTNVIRRPEGIVRQPKIFGLGAWICPAVNYLILYLLEVCVELDHLVQHDLETRLADFHGGVALEVEAVGGEVAAFGLEVSNPLAAVLWFGDAGAEVACSGEVTLVLEGEVGGDFFE